MLIQPNLAIGSIAYFQMTAQRIIRQVDLAIKKTPAILRQPEEIAEEKGFKV